MADKSAIEWTDATWNPTTGCDRISAGCDNCYALTLAKRLKAMGSAKYQTDGDPRTSGPGFGVAVHEDALSIPLKWKTPRTVFVNSMSDLFHARVPASFVAQVWAVMAKTPQHTYQILTKRPERMARVVGSVLTDRPPLTAQDEETARTIAAAPWPLPNVWLGTSVEDQEHADQRIPALLRTPAAVRFLSCEPLLGPVELPEFVVAGALDCPCETGRECLPNIDWVIAGGESGPGARPMHPDWARGLRDQCAAGGIPYFFKQWGEWIPNPSIVEQSYPYDGSLDVGMWRVGKKRAGRKLDGRTHDEYPGADRDR